MRRVPGRPSGSSKIPRLGALVLLAAFITFANYSYYHNKVCPRPTACRMCPARLPAVARHARSHMRRTDVVGQNRPSWLLLAIVRPSTPEPARRKIAGDPNVRGVWRARSTCASGSEQRTPHLTVPSSHRSTGLPLLAWETKP